MTIDTALITGASSGIGLHLAEALAARRTHLTLVARSAGKLEELAARLRAARPELGVLVVAADLADPAGVDRVADALAAAGLRCALLVNNAGFGQRGAFADIPWERQRAMVRLNIETLTALTWRLLPQLKAARGAILNVASTAAFQPGPWMSVYYATKAYVLSFSEGLREELRADGVRVVCLCPGPTITGFADDAGMNDTMLFKMNAMPVQRVVAAALRGLDRDRAVVIPGVMNRLVAFSTRFMPRILNRRIAGWVQR